jgi:hypothetical protein
LLHHERSLAPGERGLPNTSLVREPEVAHDGWIVLAMGLHGEQSLWFCDAL